MVDLQCLLGLELFCLHVSLINPEIKREILWVVGLQVIHVKIVEGPRVLSLNAQIVIL
jgi:hypothetical protein